LTFSGLFGSEKIIDRGDQPFFNADLSKRQRLWQFLEDELKTTVMASSVFRHSFKEAGHLINLAFNYTFHREDEQYFYDNIIASGTGTDAFKLLSDEQVFDLTGDYIKPMKHGKAEAGFKARIRSIPTDMDFRPGLNSILDLDAGGWANYREIIPAIYGNYVIEKQYWEAEMGVRMEYVSINYDVNPNHRTYKSDGYHYTEPFPSLRMAYKFDAGNKVSFFYNRRVDRPNEVDIRIFPKYDDAEIIKVGNPGLRPQFTNSIELGYKRSWPGGSLYTAGFYRFSDGTITRISSIVPGSPLIYAIFQNAGKSRNTGLETILDHKFTSRYSFSLNATVYHHEIDAFSVSNRYPREHQFTSDQQSIVSGNIKWNQFLRGSNGWEFQTSVVYIAPDIIPQGKIYARLSIDAGLKRSFRNKKSECFLNATDIAGTFSIRRKIYGAGFFYTSNDYYETQAVKIGYHHNL
jgi:outer membrane receptor protein involved in Fe transport